MRSAGPGTYRSDAGQFIPSQQRDGFPMVYGVVKGHAVFVEVVVIPDQLFELQKETISDLIEAGASGFVARNFIGFVDWFTALLPTLTNDDALPFGPAPRDQN